MIETNLLLLRFKRKKVRKKERRKEGKIEVSIYAGINTAGYVLALISN
jgi:hypothetical protein